MSVATADAGALIACSEVTVVHGGGKASVRALAGVDLGISDGESVGLLGPSGSGKTTLLHVLGGLIPPTSGAVLWHGEPLASLDRAARRRGPVRRIAYVFQGANLLPSLNARENIAFAILATRGTGAPEDFLALVGLESKALALPADLSGGEQQRVALARALAQGPELLLCDEPTGHLDSDTGGRVLDLIDAAREMFGFTIVVATHDPTVGDRTDRTVELADGILRSGVAA